MTTKPIMYNCAICGKAFQFGPGRYDGRFLTLYARLPCCNSCWRANHDGWVPHLGLKLAGKAMAAGGTDYELPAQQGGLYPRE